MTSEAIPHPIAKRLNCSSTARPTSACSTRNTTACGTLTCPAGIGRERVRSTNASRSRSVMSFQVQPAPRMANAPMKNSAMMTGNWLQSWMTPAASAADHQHGISSSQDPIGRSRRESRKYGRDQGGARVSTQLPVASATRAPAVLIGSSREHVAVQGIERAAALLGDSRLRKCRRRAQHLTQAWACRPSLLLLLRHGADLRLHFLGILVAVFQLVGYLRRNSALRCVGFDITDHLDFGLAETSDQLAGFIRGRMPVAGRLDQFATLLGLFPQGYELPHAVIRGRSSLRGSRSTLERGAGDRRRSGYRK